MKTIHKFYLEKTRIKTISLEPNAKMLSVQVQKDSVVMWVELDINEPRVDRTFAIIPTGVEFDSETKRAYIGTFQIVNFVGHVYEILR